MVKYQNKIIELEKEIDYFKENPNPILIDKITNIFVQKLKDRDKIIDLELKNLSQTIQLNIQNHLKSSQDSFEKKIELKIQEIIRAQKERISWGLELARFIIIFITFILSLKVMPIL